MLKDKMDKEDGMKNQVFRKLAKENEELYQKGRPICLYHGSKEERFMPQFGKGEAKHDYGRGFYTTLDYELACEWAFYMDAANGYVHKYVLDTTDLYILDFNANYNVLNWLATLAKHRTAGNSKRYKRNEELLIQKYYDKEIEKADVIIGYRADDSYFKFAKMAIRNELDIHLLDSVMREGNLGYQVFIQSEKAFHALKEVDINGEGYFRKADLEYKRKYDLRDKKAREDVDAILGSSQNTLQDTIEKYLDI